MSETIQSRHRWPAWLGLVAHVGLGLFPYLFTGLLAPPYGVAIVFVGWFALLGLAIMWWRPRPLLVLLVPVLAIAWWFAVLFFGDFVLGWTA